MSAEKPSKASNSPNEPGSPLQKEAKSIEGIGEPDQSFRNLALSPGKDVSSVNGDSQDRASDQSPLNKHLRSMMKDLLDNGPPPMSSRSSVVWKDLVVRGAGSKVTYQQTVGQILRGLVDAIHHLTFGGKPLERVILHDVEGVLREGQMLLILGRPGSGCSTLLKTLCGLTDEYLGWQGDIRYNGVDVKTFKRLFPGDAVYTPEGKNLVLMMTISTNAVQWTFIFLISRLATP